MYLQWVEVQFHTFLTSISGGEFSEIHSPDQNPSGRRIPEGNGTSVASMEPNDNGCLEYFCDNINVTVTSCHSAHSVERGTQA
jgi:hypothetical protein